MASLIDLLGLTREELAGLIQGMGQPAYRADQIWHWVYRDLAEDFDRMTNLPAALRESLAKQYSLAPGRLLQMVHSRDGETHKALLELRDGETVECVLMTYERRRTACLSVQVGCPIGCAFCATGQAGFRRDLTAGEIVFQALHLARLAAREAPAGERPLTNIVFMGMGEPLLNYDETMRSIQILTEGAGFGLGARRITLSTAGVAPGIRRLAGEPWQLGLAISLHAPEDALRDRLVPLNHRYPLAQLMAAVKDYVEITGRRVTFEYALIDQLNDEPAHAEGVARLLAGLLAHVNLIPVNPAQGSPYQPSPRTRVERFVATLEAQGIPCSVRLRRGIDIHAGCGQLRNRYSAGSLSQSSEKNSSQV